MSCSCFFVFFFFKQKTAYEMRISDWSSDVCSSDLGPVSGFGSCVKEVRAPRSCGRIDGKPHRVRWPHGPGTSGARRVSGQQQEGGTGRGGGRCSRWKAERE